MTFKVQPAPTNIENVAKWTEEQLRKVVDNLDLVDNITLKELHVEPDKPRNGQIILADGTDFDPGSGAGFYGRSAGVWVLLG